ncbi:MAG: hypothetical protein F4X08_00775 [Gemmatimonadetes bacterium]|nr:hypothetical protein [Gemmatimonadota bacterium]MYD24334.1 hypothetical protein [Gemmatimonadota bacterium]MYJ00464.1 hypothetical protein [Gemmatimonadota bacterium]
MKARYWVGGCLSAIILLAVIVGAAYYFILQASDELVDTYTSPEPRDFARAEEGRDEALSVIDRFRDFVIALERGEETESFSLSADDINALLEYEDLLREFHGMARVDIQDDRLLAEISVPLDLFNERFEGRYLNGTGELSVEMRDGRLEVNIDRLEVGGRNIPEEFMNEIRKNNVVETLLQDPSLERFMGLVKSVKVEDGRVVIEPK